VIVAAVGDRVLAPAVGAAALLLTAASLAMTIVLGCPTARRWSTRCSPWSWA
jgi:hypothetical protein